ncbi:unnamed protein product (macronuclear) [Paramecium tetraurelia]|uniref:Transmembrane protein n=1 Tax=Paramecium tetraurelia TaxID=5888 RepID=A0BM01_PARTE|nr:uncharacterized protein GSPATT00030202001 [Paramecium tetraurelia]CAK59568.1 unnamed protein product [Paramecium tetraurelia]|eukprot:XP_001426966.1 hypothetical protein (macronuclear) [Paramecium tetraurelia strain d4-2]
MKNNEQISFENVALKTSPENETVVELEFQQTQSETQLDQILEEQRFNEMLKQCEQKRIEKLQRYLINNLQKIISEYLKNFRIDYLQQEKLLIFLTQYTEQSNTLVCNDNEKLKKIKQRTQKWNKFEQQLVYYSSINISQYYVDKSIDCRWKLLFTYYIIIIGTNITLNLIELIRYQQSFCRLQGLDHSLIYINQIAYIACKVGILNIIYQEFTNTLPIKVKVPLLNQVVFSCIFPILSMPLYIFDFVQCQYRIKIFTLDQSLKLLNLIDWLILSLFILIIIIQSCCRIQISSQALQKVMQELHIQQEIHEDSLLHFLNYWQSFENIMPAMIMENYYFIFSVVLMCYLSIQKYFFHKIPFQQNSQDIENHKNPRSIKS